MWLVTDENTCTLMDAKYIQTEEYMSTCLHVFEGEATKEEDKFSLVPPLLHTTPSCATCLFYKHHSLTDPLHACAPLHDLYARSRC